MTILTKEVIYQKTPQQLTALLYEAGLNQFASAVHSLQQKDFEEANRSMQKINDILERLGAGLNYEAGIIADQLDAVYNYLADTVIQANVKKDAALLSEAQSLFETVADAWTAAIKNAPAKPSFKKPQQAYEQNVLMESQPPGKTIEMGN